MVPLIARLQDSLRNAHTQCVRTIASMPLGQYAIGRPTSSRSETRSCIQQGSKSLCMQRLDLRQGLEEGREQSPRANISHSETVCVSLKLSEGAVRLIQIAAAMPGAQKV